MALNILKNDDTPDLFRGGVSLVCHFLIPKLLHNVISRSFLSSLVVAMLFSSLNARPLFPLKINLNHLKTQ